MTAAHDLWHGVLALAEMTRETDQATLERLERQHAKVAQRTWARVWPTAEKRLLAAVDQDDPPVSNMDAALEDVGAMFGDHLTEDDEEDLVRIVANAYALGQVSALETAKARGYPATWTGVDGALVVGRAVDAPAIFGSALDPAMTIRDRRAAQWLADDTMFWIRDCWNQGLGAQISGYARDELMQGGRRADVIKRLKAGLGSRFSEPTHYWDVVANASMQRGRSMGTVSGFIVAGVSTFEFVAMMDERTSPICRDLDGTIYTIEHAKKHVDAILETNNPDEFKAVSPWVKPSEVKGKSADELAAMGVMLPPLHGRCRSTIVAAGYDETVEEVPGLPSL